MAMSVNPQFYNSINRIISRRTDFFLSFLGNSSNGTKEQGSDFVFKIKKIKRGGEIHSNSLFKEDGERSATLHLKDNS